MKYEKIGKTKKKIKNLKEVIKMKDLKAFLEVMGKDKALSEKVRSASDVKEMVKIANEAGYAVTEDDMNDLLMDAVAGGLTFGEFLDYTEKALDQAKDVAAGVGSVYDDVQASKESGAGTVDTVLTGIASGISSVSKGAKRAKSRWS